MVAVPIVAVRAVARQAQPDRERGRRRNCAAGNAAETATSAGLRCVALDGARPALRGTVGAGGRWARLDRADRFGRGGALCAAGARCTANCALRFTICPTGPARPRASAARQRIACSPIRRARLVGRRSRARIRLWLFDRDFQRALEAHVRLRRALVRNKGGEALATATTARCWCCPNWRRGGCGRRAERARQAPARDVATRRGCPTGGRCCWCGGWAWRGFHNRSCGSRRGGGQAGAAGSRCRWRRSTMPKGSRPRPARWRNAAVDRHRR